MRPLAKDEVVPDHTTVMVRTVVKALNGRLHSRPGNVARPWPRDLQLHGAIAPDGGDGVDEVSFPVEPEGVGGHARTDVMVQEVHDMGSAHLEDGGDGTLTYR